MSWRYARQCTDSLHHTNNAPAKHVLEVRQTVHGQFTRIPSLGTTRIRAIKLHTPRFIIPKKSTRYTFVGARLGPRAGLCISKRETSLLPLLEIEPRNRGCPRPSLPTIPNDENMSAALFDSMQQTHINNDVHTYAATPPD